ncbi:efflux RND transporter periplasmic adaptor subunit [Spongiibacter nanhainus]|uniref:Efflux RND transporter periplasmic adaptor subunit n=1 Tax=Spongiibacter nanhainus TaxID=2794344 RepID=A0A7T4R4B4_9GAMM|nr:efflux RND transporter periplasmic adaptor subunit [Spongiibacter nanhainus]QQD19932.1 efflux RND transporter periplasmic adaptor subunit [Spongiibacter nanhainus]
MKRPDKHSVLIISALLLGTAVTAYNLALWQGDGADDKNNKKPLYWVAPMDPNFKRDQPGKSPMGMDLIPVYEEGDNGGEQGAGAVTISPNVVNNLGVRTAGVTRGQLAMTVNTVGYVQYDEDRLIHIHPRVEGWVEKLHVKAAGDPVAKGAVLYTLYSPMLVNAQEELQLALKRNNPTLIAAAMERLEALQVPQADIDRIKRTGKVSQTITVAAPQSGVLDNLMVREGMFVKPGMEMMSIGQLEHIWVIGEVFERQAVSVKEGDPVRMRLDYVPGREWTGKVDYIYPTLNPKTRTAQVRVRFDNNDRYLKPGMFAQMAIDTHPSEAALLIPREALIRTGSQSRVVLAQGEGRFKSIAVKVGRVGEDQVEILSGLVADDRIVTSAQFLIDSESSKSSDFKRMDHGDMKVEPDNTAEVSGTVNRVDVQAGTVNISRGAIAKWGRPASTLDFGVGRGVDLDALSEGDRLRFRFRVDNGTFTVVEVLEHGASLSDTDQRAQEHSHD